MKNYAESLSKELLHTPRREWPKVIATRVFEAQGRSYCSYCGEVSEMGGLTHDERAGVMVAHIMTCPKRPEMKLLGVAVAAAEYVEERTDDTYGNLVSALDGLKAKQ